MSKFMILILVSSFALAQESERDYGNLVPEHFFKITQKKTSLEDNPEIANYKIVVSPIREEFTYKFEPVRTPKKIPFGKSKDFKLVVDREHGNIKRISSLNFSSGSDGYGDQTVITASLGNDGFIDSLSSCSQDYYMGRLGIKKDKSNFQCITINRDICDYIEKSKIDNELVQKISNCSEILGKMHSHQDYLREASKTDSKNDISALNKLDGRLKDVKNFYQFSGNSLLDVSDMATGYSKAIKHCNFLKQNNYLREKGIVEPEVENEAKQD